MSGPGRLLLLQKYHEGDVVVVVLPPLSTYLLHTISLLRNRFRARRVPADFKRQPFAGGRGTRAWAVMILGPRSVSGWPGHKMEKKCNGPHLAGSQKKKWDFLGFPQSAQNSLLAKPIVALTFVLLFCRQADTPNITPSLVINNLTLS